MKYHINCTNCISMLKSNVIRIAFPCVFQGNRTIEDHTIAIYANKYTPVDGKLIPTGEKKILEIDRQSDAL